jgi:hypothetical protein
MADSVQRWTCVVEVLIESGAKIQINIFWMVGILMILSA